MPDSLRHIDSKSDNPAINVVAGLSDLINNIKEKLNLTREQTDIITKAIGAYTSKVFLL